MADKFPCSIGQIRKRLAQQRTIAGVMVRISFRIVFRIIFRGVFQSLSRSRLDHSDHTVGSKQPGALRALVEWSRESVQRAHLSITLPEFALVLELLRGHRFYGNNRIANRAHSTDSRRPQQGDKNLRENVSVFMAVEVRHMDSGSLNLSYLRGDFRNQLIAV